MKPLIYYIINEGRKQKVSNWRQFIGEIQQKYGHDDMEYFKGISDYLMFDLMWKFPIKFLEVKTKNIKMGYSGLDAKEHSILYGLNNHVIKFVFNDFFTNPFVFIKIDDEDVTRKIKGDFGDIPINLIMCNKEKLTILKDILDKLQ